MPDYTLERNRGATGPGGRVEHAANVTVSDGDTYETGLSSIDSAQATAQTADTVVGVTGVDGGTLTLSVQTGGAAGDNEDVYIDAIGER